VTNRRLLFSLAHPDDESFGSGGTIARYVAEGVDVYLLCATSGEAGTVPKEMLNGYASIAELRLAELDCAAANLGIKQVFKLGYRDSGMMNSETSRDPACLWQAPREQVARRVVEVIREVMPQVVVTFNRYGGYGHPDHIAIQRATVDAFKLAGDPTFSTDGQTPYQPQKLYYTAFPTLSLRLMLAMMRARGRDPRHFGRNHDIDMLAILENVEPAHTVVDVRAYLRDWDEASGCHASQIGGGFPRLPLRVRQVIAGHQSFTRVFPNPTYNKKDERDLFAGVTINE
jgi:LmbE family N-acetylglucosaminyl deacetylase